MSDNKRYLLYLDILGFKSLVENNSPDYIHSIISAMLSDLTRWKAYNRKFNSLYFSDTFILYQKSYQYTDQTFLDIYGIASSILCSLLAKGVPARGVITHGSFTARIDESSCEAIYFGEALIRAYEAEQKEKWIGITIDPTAWSPFEHEKQGRVQDYEDNHVWKRRKDDTLLLNPFMNHRIWRRQDPSETYDMQYLRRDDGEWINEIRAFSYLSLMAEHYRSGKRIKDNIAKKYIATDDFLREVMGDEDYLWMLSQCE